MGKRFIECPECKSVIREDVKTCPHCRTKVNKRFKGSMDKKSGSFIFYAIFIASLFFCNWIFPYIESFLNIKFGGAIALYGIGISLFVTFISIFYIEVRAKRKHDKENKKVYVDLDDK